MSNSKKRTTAGNNGVEIGGHTYSLLDVSSRFFGPMWIVLQDGGYFSSGRTWKEAFNATGIKF